MSFGACQLLWKRPDRVKFARFWYDFWSSYVIAIRAFAGSHAFYGRFFIKVDRHEASERSAKGLWGPTHVPWLKWFSSERKPKAILSVTGFACPFSYFVFQTAATATLEHGNLFASNTEFHFMYVVGLTTVWSNEYLCMMSARHDLWDNPMRGPGNSVTLM